MIVSLSRLIAEEWVEKEVFTNLGRVYRGVRVIVHVIHFVSYTKFHLDEKLPFQLPND